MKKSDVQQMIDDYDRQIFDLKSEINSLYKKLKFKQMYIADLTQWIGYSYEMWLRPVLKQGSYDYTRVHEYMKKDNEIGGELADIAEKIK